MMTEADTAQYDPKDFPARPAFILPCDCGSRDAWWHGPEDGLRVYCCAPCWERDGGTAPALNKRKPTKVKP